MTVDSWLGLDHELRRVVPRQPVDWHGFYALEGDQSGQWRECRFVDISPAGAGLVLVGTTAEEAAGRHVLLAVQLRAEVKNLTEQCGELRAGTQFVGLSATEQEYLLSMARIGTRW
jgi:hypothetical protein